MFPLKFTIRKTTKRKKSVGLPTRDLKIFKRAEKTTSFTAEKRPCDTKKELDKKKMINKENRKPFNIDNTRKHMFSNFCSKRDL